MKMIQSTTLHRDGSTDTVATGQESSVEITQDSKGKFKVTVKIYDADPQKAADEAISLYEDIMIKLGRLEL